MKIDEAIKIINSTKTVRASLEKEKIYFYEYTVSKFDYFLVMPQKANNWDNVEEDFEDLYSTTPKDLARVMDVIQRLLDTPVKERFPEKKYTIQVIANCASAYLNCNKGDNHMMFCSGIETDHVKTRFTQSEIDELKQCDDLAIDWDKAIIKEAKDDED